MNGLIRRPDDPKPRPPKQLDIGTPEGSVVPSNESKDGPGNNTNGGVPNDDKTTPPKKEHGKDVDTSQKIKDEKPPQGKKRNSSGSNGS